MADFLSAMEDMRHQLAANEALERHNRAQQITNQYLPQTLSGKLGLLHAQTGLTNVQIPFMQQKTRLLPLDKLINIQNAQNAAARVAQSRKRFGDMFSLKQLYMTASPAERSEMHSQNPQAWNYIFSNMANKAYQSLLHPPQHPQGTNYFSPGLIKHFFPNVNIDELPKSVPLIPPDAQPPSSPVMPSPTPTVPSQMQPPSAQGTPTQQTAMPTPAVDTGPLETLPGPFQPPTSQQVQEFKGVAESQKIKSLTTTAVQNMRRYASHAATTYNQAAEYIPAVQSFAGIGGSFNQLLSKVGASAGFTNPKYLQLLKFKQTAIILANEIKRNLSGPSTDKEQALMSTLADPKTWAQSPKIVLGLFQNLGKILNRIDIQLKKSPADIKEELGTQIKIPGMAQPLGAGEEGTSILSSPFKNPNLSLDKLQVAASARNMSVSQLITLLKSKGAL